MCGRKYLRAFNLRTSRAGCNAWSAAATTGVCPGTFKPATAWGRSKEYRRAHGLIDARLVAADLEEQNRAGGQERARSHPVIQAAFAANWGDPKLRVDWGVGMSAAEQFHAGHGHLNVPDGTTISDVQLAIWLARQREHRRRDRLTAEQIETLDRLGMDWRNREEIRARLWDRGLAAAQTWHREHGHLRVPSGAEVDDVKLANWLHDRRKDRRLGRLAKDREDALDALGMEWTTRQPATDGPTRSQRSLTT